MANFAAALKPEPALLVAASKAKRERKRPPYIDEKKPKRERYVRLLLDLISRFRDAHDKLKPIHVQDAPEVARLWLPASYQHLRPLPAGNILDQRRQASREMEQALFGLRSALNDRRRLPAIAALSRAYERRRRQTKSGRKRRRTIKRVTLRPGPLNYLDGLGRIVLERAETLTLRAFSFFGERLTPESVESFAAAPPDHSRAVQWQLAWDKLGETLATIDLPKLYNWLDRLQTFQPSRKQLRILELLRNKFLTADNLGSRLWPNCKGRQGARLARDTDFVELEELGLVAHKSGSGYFMPFDPPTGFSPVIPELIAVPRRVTTESPTPLQPAGSPRRDTAS